MQNKSAQYASLQQYIGERLQILDPTIDVSTGSAAYTAVIYPLMTRLGTDPMSTDVESFLLQRVKDAYPELDVTSAGSALRDVLVTPIAMFLEPLRREIEYARLNKSLAPEDVSAMTLAEVDALLANLMTGVNTGAFSYGVVRCFFGAQRTVGLDQTVTFSTSAGVQFLPQYATTYLPSDMTRLGNQWYIDVPVQSVEPATAANVDPDTVKYVTNLQNCIRVTNPAKIEGGFTAQIGTEAVASATRSLTEHSLVSSRAIETTLRNNVTGITSIEVTGYGQAGMDRDLITVDAAPVDDQPGAVVAVSGDFETAPTVLLNGEGGTAYLPFTNRIIIRNTDEWPAAQLAAAREAKFAQVLDGTGGYAPGTLSRVRKVVSTYLEGSDLHVTLADFVAYPYAAAPDTGVTQAGATTYAADMLALNAYAAQGTAYRLFATDPAYPGDPDHTWHVGAPLPFTDVVAVGGLPSAVEFGRDYLVLVSRNTTANPTYQPEGAAWWYPASVRMHPVDAIPAPGRVRVARQDAHLVEQARAPGAWAGALSDGAPFNARNARVEIVSFGAPAIDPDPAIAYDGMTVNPWGRNPGVTLTADLTNVATAAVTCVVKLNPSYAGTWLGMGVKVGHHISLAALMGASPAVAPPYWTAWGRITDVTAKELTVEGLDWTGLSVAGTNDGSVFYLTAPEHVLAWTVYVGERALLDASGAPVTSYDELSFLPAYMTPDGDSEPPSGDAARQRARVANRSFSDYRTWATDKHGYGPHAQANTMMAYGLDGTLNTATACWVRLERPFDAADPTSGVAPVDQLRGPRVVLLDTVADYDVVDGAAIDTYGPPTADARTAYARTRLRSEDVVLDNDVGDPVPALVAPSSLPYASGQAVSIANGALTDAGGSANPARQSGYLLPYPIRNGSTGPQIVQLMAAAAAAPPPKLTLSGIPGGVPFPKAYPGAVTFDSNQLHIGGAVDAHIKPAASTAGVTMQATLSPENLLDNTAVLFTGADGAVDSATPTTFYSASLSAFLTSLYPDMVANSVALEDLCVEVINRPSNAAITPSAFRITHNILGSSAVCAVASFSDTFQDVQFRLLRRVDVELTAPVRVLQQGLDAQTSAGAAAVQIPSGVRFLESPLAVSIYVRIGVAPLQTEYQVLSVTPTSMTLDRAPTVSLAGQPYRVYVRAFASATNPVVRVSSVQLGLSGTGTPVPYRHPVGNYLTALASLNDDPLGHTEFSDLTTGTDGDGLATLQSDNDFAAQGVTTYDVVVLSGFPDGDQYFWIRSISGTGPYVLHLDRPFVAVQSGAVATNYQIGHPAVGTMRCYFVDPTYFSVGPNVTFQHTSANGVKSWFRPSPAESTPVYEPSRHTTDCLLEAPDAPDDPFLASTSHDFMADGVRKGDVVELISRVLRSTTFTVANTADELIGGVAGRRLSISVAGQPYSILFSGASMTSLDAIRTDIQQRLSTLVTVAVETVTSPSGFQLAISSYLPISILPTNTPALLSALRLTVTENDSDDAIGHLIPVIGTEHTLAGAYRILLDRNDTAGAPINYDSLKTNQVFFRVKRLEVQTTYPAGMVQTGTLWGTDVKVTSFAPRNSATTMPTDGLDILGEYGSYGYELQSRNPSYSYSTLDQLVLRVTPLVLAADATGLDGLVCALGSPVTVTYETAPEVVSSQQLMMRTDIRNATSNPLARHFFPAYPAMDLTYNGTVDAATIQAALTTLFVGLYPNKALVASDVIGALLKSGATTVKGPLQVGYLVVGADRRYRLLLSQDSVTLPAGYHVMGELDYVQINGGA